MNPRHPLVAVTAGLIGLIMMLIAHVVAVVATLDIDIVGGSSRPFSIADWLVWYLGVPLVACVASAWPMHVAGIPWQRGAAGAFIAHLSAIFIVINVVIPLQRSSAPLVNLALLMALEAVITLLLITLGALNTRIIGAGAAAVFLLFVLGAIDMSSPSMPVGTMLLIFSFVLSVTIVLFAWVILPAWAVSRQGRISL